MSIQLFQAMSVDKSHPTPSPLSVEKTLPQTSPRPPSSTHSTTPSTPATAPVLTNKPSFSNSNSRPPLQKQSSLHQQQPPHAKSLSQSADRDDDKGSIINTFTDELNGYAQTASNTISELFGECRPSLGTN